MRFDKRALFKKNDLSDVELPVNLTSMGAQQQQLVFGDTKQERVVARFQRPISVRTGYFIVEGTNYQILRNISGSRRTALYGVEYHGRL